ncbi:MAG: M28 family metallopeptidase, partial [Chloroflexi bacterium]|nr:M28 family metallopeptidase [Chloroflexota bacterium]
MQQFRRFLPFHLILLLLGLACSLLAEPPAPVIPTPPPTVPAVSFEELPVFNNPQGSVMPAVDPDIAALMNAVSQQQLVAYVQTLEAFGTRNTFSETQREDYGLGAARTWIYNEFNRVNGGALQVTYDDFPLNVGGLVTSQRNVIATLPGVSGHPGVVVLMAHYDSRNADPNDGGGPSPGANDNATGVAILLELARLMSARPWNQTVVFAAFTAEEQGTYGSRHWVQDRMLNGLVIDAAINNDIVGGRPGIVQAIRIFSSGPETSGSRQLARYFNLVSSLYLPNFRIALIDGVDREGRYSDHREFLNAGVPTVRLTEFEEDFSVQHTAQDTSEKIDYNYLFQVAQLNLVVLANMAGAPPPPAAPAVAPMADPGAYILNWQPDPQAAGYAIAFRPVGLPDQLPYYHFVNASQAGNVALTGLEPQVTYAVSLAALDANGRI